MTNINVVEAFYEALRQSDYGRVDKLLDKDFVLEQAASLPYGGAFRGLEGIQEFFKMFFGVWQQFRSEEVVYFELDKERVLALSRIKATARSGGEIDMPMAQIFKVKNQKLAEARPFYWDTVAVVKAVESAD